MSRFRARHFQKLFMELGRVQSEPHLKSEKSIWAVGEDPYLENRVLGGQSKAL